MIPTALQPSSAAKSPPSTPASPPVQAKKEKEKKKKHKNDDDDIFSLEISAPANFKTGIHISHNKYTGELEVNILSYVK